MYYNVSMNRKIVLAPEEYYHIYNRGVEKRTIFLSTDDKNRFQALLYLCNGKDPVVYRLVQGETLYSHDVGKKITAIGAYVLMPNHFHLVLKETEENGITDFLRKLTTAYTMYFNKKYERVGPLFQGVFKAEHLDTDEYLKYQFAYTHLNPVKLLQNDWRESGIKNMQAASNYLDAYQYSSYLCHIGIRRNEKAILSLDEFPEYFSENGSFKSFIGDWIQYKASP